MMRFTLSTGGTRSPACAEASAGRPAERGFQQWISTEDRGDYTRYLISKDFAPDKPNGGFSEVAVSNLPIELSRPKFLEKHACDFIEKHQRDPFILVVAFVEPHSPYNGPLNNVNPLDEVELDAIRAALARHDGNVVAAAEELGMSRSALYRRMEKFGL